VKPRVGHISVHPAFDGKVIDIFRMVSTSSATMQSFEKLELRVPAVGAKICCLYVFRKDDENQDFFPSAATRFTDLCEIWHDRGARGSAWRSESSLQLV